MSAVVRVFRRRILPLMLGGKGAILRSAGTRVKNGKLKFAPRPGSNLVVNDEKWRPVKLVTQSTE